MPSDVSDESTGSEHMLIHHQPSVDNNDGSQQWYAPSSTGRTQVSKVGIGMAKFVHEIFAFSIVNCFSICFSCANMTH